MSTVDATPVPPRFSVVVPARDAAGAIGRCLQAFVPGLRTGEAEVVVVAYGCSDASAEIAARHAGVRVIELPEGSRAEALNTGEAAVRAFPRLYLDPTSVVSAAGLRLLADHLDDPEPRAVVPTQRVVADERTSPVRSFYALHDKLPAPRHELLDGGVYGLSRAGRERFDAFPEGEEDTHFLHGVLARGERHVLREASIEVDAPRGLRDLVARRSATWRARRAQTPLASAARHLVVDLRDAVLDDPRSAPAAALYAGIEGAALLRARHEPPPADEDPAPDDAPVADDRVVIGGVAFDRTTEEAVIARVLGDLAHDRGGLLLTPNIDILRQLRRPEHADLLGRADLVVADGTPIVWASRLAGDPLPERVTGSSLIWTLSGAAAAAGHRVMLLGGAEGAAERAAGRLEVEHPDLQRVPWHFPPFGFDVDEASCRQVVEAVEGAQPRIVFVGLGFPRQERFALRLLEQFPSTWFIGCGGSIAMLAGDVSRAPVWMQRAGLEWLHRLAQEPQRLVRRYLVDDAPYALRLLARSALQRTRRGAAAASGHRTTEPPLEHVEGTIPAQRALVRDALG